MQNVWETLITARFRWVQRHKHSQVSAFNSEVFWLIFPMGGECSWSPAGVATVQPSSPQPAGSPVWMTSLSRWSEYHLSPQRGGVELAGGHPVNNSSFVGLGAGLQLWLSKKSVQVCSVFASTGLKSSPEWGGGKLALLLWLSLRCSPGGGGAADRRQVVVSRDVAVHWEVVVALGVLMWSVTEGTLTFWGGGEDEHIEISRHMSVCHFFGFSRSENVDSSEMVTFSRFNNWFDYVSSWYCI